MSKTKKKVMICFYKGDINNDIHVLENLDSKGFEVHLFNNIDETNLKCDSLFYIIKDLYENAKNDYDIYISSNIKEFILIQYILYKNYIAAALYLNNNPVHFKLEELYKLILDTNLGKDSLNFYVLKNENNIFNKFIIFNGEFKLDTGDKYIENAVYNFNGMNHVFAIVDNENINVINLDNSKNNGTYYYHFDLGYLDEFLKLIWGRLESTNEFFKSQSLIHSRLSKLKERILNLFDFEKRIVKFKLENELYKNETIYGHKIFLSSILFYIFNDKKYLEYIMTMLIKSKFIDKYSKFFVYYQYVRYIFVSKNEFSNSTEKILEKLYYTIFEEFFELSKIHKRITRDKRNKQLVFVFIGQFLNINHSPSKIALDICYNLMKELDKKVILINTREVLPCKGLIPMINIAGASVNKDLNNVNSVIYKDTEIPFYQSKVSMPHDSEIMKILNMVVSDKPDLIINIGTCLVGDLCSKIVPTATYPLERNGYSKSTFLIVNDENECRKRNNRDKRSLIIREDVFELKPKKYVFTKEELGIPKNKFIITIIGNRLEEEIDEAFLDMLDKACKYSNAYVLFIGQFNFKNSYVNAYRNLTSNYKNMGYQQDLLSVLEHVDIYANPNRRGGGTSAIYAMYLGKPVVTLDNGDVAISTGKEFEVSNYEEMQRQINKYYSDNDFYKRQSVIAKQRALRITDMLSYVKDVYKKVEENPLFY